MPNFSLIKVDLVIPVYNGFEDLKYLSKSFLNQKRIKIENVVVPITVGNDVSEANRIKNLCEKLGYIHFKVKKEAFSHSLVRETAIKNYCKSDIVILLTQDLKLIDETAMYNLVKDIRAKKVAYSFGRQTCPTRRIEYYIRQFNYPPESRIITKNDIKTKQIKVFFASDVFAGLDRNIFLKLNGYQGLKLSTNEDMFYMHELLINGYKAKYCADAIVEHYHSLTPSRLYKRYYETGRFFKTVKIFDKYNKNKSGRQLACYVLKEAFKHFDIISIIRWPSNMAIRYIAMKKGERA